MPAKGEKIPIETQPSYGELILEILLGNNRGAQIAHTIGKTQPAVFQQLEKLVTAKYVTKENSVYSVDKQKLVSYWAKKFVFDKESKKIALERFDAIISSQKLMFNLLTGIKTRPSIDMLGGWFNQSIQLGKNPENMRQVKALIESLSGTIN